MQVELVGQPNPQNANGGFNKAHLVSGAEIRKNTKLDIIHTKNTSEFQDVEETGTNTILTSPNTIPQSPPLGVFRKG